ncbi:MAG: hypothetical protein JW929_03865 [Anaerolineales bacterium]|nr:hypothetical protein [Anaerolineales bacterium]
MKILIPLFSPPTGTWGSLTRVLALGSAAVVRGHAVAFCAAGYLADRLEALGHLVFRMPQTTMFGLPKPLSDAFSARSQNVVPPVPPGRSIGSIWLVLMITGIARYGYLRRLVSSQLAAVDEYKPDFLFTEVDPGAFLVSRIRGIPIACTYAGMLKVGIGGFAWRMVHAAAGRVLRDFGKESVEPQEMILDRRTLKIVPSIPELEPEAAASPDYVFTGSLFRSFRAAADSSFQAEPGRRYAFAYLGTGSVGLPVMRKVLPQVFPDSAGGGTPRLFCLVGSQTLQKEERIGGVVFRPFWDAENLLPHCDWTFCHGGHNTIIQSLAHKVPLLLFPGPIFERRFNAERVQAAGAGRFGEAPDFNARWIGEVMSGREAYAAAAARLGEKICALGGPPRAVEALETWNG